MVTVGLPATNSGSRMAPSFLMTRRRRMRPSGSFCSAIFADRLLRLDADELVLEHAARAVRVNPHRGVVEDARGGARPSRLPDALVRLGDDLAAVESIGLELRHPFDELDGARELGDVASRPGSRRPARGGAPGDRPRRSARRRAPCAPRSRVAFWRVRAPAAASESEVLTGARQHVREAVRDVLAIGTALAEPLELVPSSLDQSRRASARSTPISLSGFGAWRLRGDLVRFDVATLFLQHVEELLQDPLVLREALGEVAAASPIAPPSSRAGRTAARAPRRPRASRGNARPACGPRRASPAPSSRLGRAASQNLGHHSSRILRHGALAQIARHVVPIALGENGILFGEGRGHARETAEARPDRRRAAR